MGGEPMNDTPTRRRVLTALAGMSAVGGISGAAAGQSANNGPETSVRVQFHSCSQVRVTGAKRLNRRGPFPYMVHLRTADGDHKVVEGTLEFPNFTYDAAEDGGSVISYISVDDPASKDSLVTESNPNLSACLNNLDG